MPWEKTFDLNEATDKAITVFAKNGYEGTSLSDLIDAMGINKGSLYNAFGSKRALFNRALLRYDELNRQATLKKLEKLSDPIAALSLLFDGLIAESEKDKQNKGCLLVNTALELPNQDAEVKQMVTKAFREFEEFFKALIIKGQEQGSINTSVNADETAKSLLALVIALRVLARGTYDAGSLEAMKAGALKLVS